MKRRSLKQDKLARVYDTEILPIWAERFGRLLLKEAKVRSGAMVLNVACGTGYPALELLEMMDGGRIIAIDSSSALLDVARSKAEELSGKRIFFRTEGNKDRLSFDKDVYDLTFTNLGLGELTLPPNEALSELARVTAPEGQVLVTLPLHGTWAEFLDIYREVLTKHDRHDTLEALTAYEATLPQPEVAIEWLEAAGLVNVDLVVEEFSLLFKSSREFFFAPVIEFGPLRDWKRLAGKGQEMQDVFWFIKESIDAYFGGRAFAVSVVAGCLSGFKPAEGEEAPRRTTPEVAPADRTPDASASKLADQAPAPLEPPPLAPPPGMDALRTASDDRLDVMITHPTMSDSAVPLLGDEEVSIHELDDEDLEMLGEDFDEEADTGVRVVDDPSELDEDLDTGVREESELPEHLRRAIRDARDDLDD